MAEAYDPAITLRVRDFVEHVRRCAVEEPAAAAVRVMTVHRAKGLEFDACVCCELDGLIGQVHKQLVWTLRPRPTDPPTGVYASVKDALRPALIEHDPAIADAHAQELQRRVGDDLSALYVALTRPRYALYLLLKPLKRTKKGWSKVGLSNASPAAMLRQQLLEDPTEPAEGVLLRTGDPHWSAKLADLPAPPGPAPAMPPLRWPDAPARRSWAVINPSSLENDGAVDVDRVLELRRRSAMQRGSDVHEQLAAIRWLEEVSAPGAPVAALLEHEEVRQALSRPPGEAEVWREQRFAVRHEGQLLRGVLDRVVVERDAAGRATRAWLIDFKTDAPGEAAITRYRPQLQAYRRAVAAMLHLPQQTIRASLLFVQNGTRVDV
jgi:ATP-dependent exoDNAse (exonuclease V) beta subunit